MSYVRCDGSHGYSFNESHQAEEGAADNLCARCRAAMVEAESARPMVERTWLLYARQRAEAEGRLSDFFPSTIQVRMCGDEPIVLARLRVDPEGPHWSWYQSHHPYNRRSRGHVTMIYPAKVLVDVCFPYGTGPEVKRGHGQLVRLSAEVVRPAVHPEGIRYDDSGGEAVEKG